MDELRKCVEELINHARNSHDAVDALQFSQAACNAANAMAQLQCLDAKQKEFDKA
jgi:hypothetical protein